MFFPFFFFLLLQYFHVLVYTLSICPLIVCLLTNIKKKYCLQNRRKNNNNNLLVRLIKSNQTRKCLPLKWSWMIGNARLQFNKLRQTVKVY